MANPDEILAPDDDYAYEYSRPRWLLDTRYWALSAVVHLALVLLLVAIVLEGESPPREGVTLRMRDKPEPPDYERKKKRDVKSTPKIIHERTVERPIRQIKPEEITPEIPQGTDLNNLANLHLARSSVSTDIGVGGGGAGIYGDRVGRPAPLEGGSEATEHAVRAALEWLRRHQNADGSWSSFDFTKNCKKICANKDSARYGDGRGFEDHDVGVTGLAILAFTGYGHTHRYGLYPEYVEVLKKAMRYLKRVQVKSSDPETHGRYGTYKEDTEDWMYDHAIASMAMGELLVMSGDVIGLKKSVTDAARFILRAQNDGFGWRYGFKRGDSDTSVTGWAVLALKTARNVRPRLDIAESDYERAFAGALTWFDRATATNGKTGYMSPGDPGSRLTEGYSEPYPYSKDLSCMTAVAVLCRIFSGETRADHAIRDGVGILLRHPPRWLEHRGRVLSTVNLYYWYYGSYAVFQYGGKEWEAWNEQMIRALVENQRQGNIDEDGSWDPIGEWGIAGGRVYSTALGAMTLEVYYRFRRLESGTANGF